VIKFLQHWNETRKRAKILICASVKRTYYLVQSWFEKQRWNENKVKLKLWSRIWKSFELTSHRVAELRRLRQYRYETRNTEYYRITFISNIWTHHLKGCSSIRQHQKRTRKQKRLEMKVKGILRSPSLTEKWRLSQQLIQTAESKTLMKVFDRLTLTISFDKRIFIAINFWRQGFSQIERVEWIVLELRRLLNPSYAAWILFESIIWLKHR
jgi:hypothetical protein